MEHSAQFPDQIEDLEANIDDLETALAPLLAKPLHTQTSTLPLLDKAKLYVLYSYAIESILFSSLQAAGLNAKEHPVFAELSRLKGYFKKIKDAELGPTPTTKLDKGAAGRFIKHALSGNEKYDKERAERIAREKVKAALQKRGVHKKFGSDGEEIVEDNAGSAKEEGRRTTVPSKRKNVNEEDDRDAERSKKRRAREEQEQMHEQGDEDDMDVDAENEELYGPSHSAPPSHNSSNLTSSAPNTDPNTDTNWEQQKSRKARRAERRAGKAARRLQRAAGHEQPEESIIPTKSEDAPRTHSETFKALLEGPLPKKEKKGGKDRERAK